MASMEKARAFLDHRRVALVGVERSEKGFSRAVLRALVRHGCDVVPVNPALAGVEAEGRRCYARVQDIEPPVQGAVLMTPPARAAEVVRDCLAAGVRDVWFHRGAGPGSATLEAVAICRAAGIEPVTDLCPFMAIPGSGWFHGLHRYVRGVGRPRA
jgi:predicted CoA-binding protein